MEAKRICCCVRREVISDGTKMLSQPLEYIIEQTIEGMKSVADEIGLRGTISNFKRELL